MKILHFIIHLAVFITTMTLFFMWVIPHIDGRGMILQLGALSFIYMVVAFATEWLIRSTFIKLKPTVMKNGTIYYGDEGLAIKAAMEELALPSLKHAVVIQMDDEKGNYLYIHDKIRKIYSNKYYFRLKDLQPL